MSKLNIWKVDLATQEKQIIEQLKLRVNMYPRRPFSLPKDDCSQRKGYRR